MLVLHIITSRLQQNTNECAMREMNQLQCLRRGELSMLKPELTHGVLWWGWGLVSNSLAKRVE